MKNRFAVVAALMFIAGCQKPVHFPTTPMDDQAAKDAGAFRAYDTDDDKKPDFFLFADNSGKVTRIGYTPEKPDQPMAIVELDKIPLDQCRHVFIVLDGIGYDVMKKYYDDGGMRICNPPSRVIAPYPCLTDLCIADMTGCSPCRGFESRYFDSIEKCVKGGSNDYMTYKNQPYHKFMQYRCDMLFDGLGFLYPKSVYGKELNDFKRVFDSNKSREIRGYIVSSAGMGTSFGKEGQIECLAGAERLAMQIIKETQGKAKITFVSDHGHSYTPSTQIPIDAYLTEKGWRITDNLSNPNDVAYVRYGLETYACFGTSQPAKLAADLTALTGVTIASYLDNDSVVVLGPGGAKATIRQKNGKYKYEHSIGDPLQLLPILAKLTTDSEGYFSDRDVFAATTTHVYPDSLARLWRAHTTVAQNIPDVIISLDDKYYSGSKEFADMVKNVASTHGGLNRSNSTAFIMTSVGEIPPIMRSAEIPAAMGKLFAQKWPLEK